MTTKKILLKDVFASISEPIKAVLTSCSKSITHPGTKGDASEYQWVVWLKTYLPKRYEAEKVMQNRAIYQSRQLRKNKPATNEHNVMVSTLEL